MLWQRDDADPCSFWTVWKRCFCSDWSPGSEENFAFFFFFFFTFELEFELVQNPTLLCCKRLCSQSSDEQANLVNTAMDLVKSHNK